MENNADKTIHVFFKILGPAFFILCVRAAMVTDISYKIPQTIFYSAMNNLMLALWIAIPGMLVYIMYVLFEEKIKRLLKRVFKWFLK